MRDKEMVTIRVGHLPEGKQGTNGLDCELRLWDVWAGGGAQGSSDGRRVTELGHSGLPRCYVLSSKR